MKKIISLVLITVLVFALSITSFAAIDGFTTAATEAFTVDENNNLIIDSNGNINLAYNEALAGDYTLELDVKVGMGFEGCDYMFVIGVACAGDSWLSGVWFRYTHDFDNVGKIYITDAYNGYANVALTGTPEINLGGFNTMKVVKESGKFSFYVNGTLVLSDFAEPAGNKLVIGANYYDASGSIDFDPIVVKNFKITTAAGTTTYFAAKTPAGPADIEVIAIAGASITALIAAAFVMKARKA